MRCLSLCLCWNGSSSFTSRQYIQMSRQTTTHMHAALHQILRVVVVRERGQHVDRQVLHTGREHYCRVQPRVEQQRENRCSLFWRRVRPWVL